MDMESMIISDIALVVKVVQPEGKICHFRNRNENGLIFVDSGCNYYKHNGQYYLSDNNHAVFIPRGSTYTLHCKEKSLSYVINFNLMHEVESKEFYSLKIAPSQKILGQLEKLDILWTFQKSSYQLRCMSMLYDLLSQLNEKIGPKYLPKYKYDQIAPSLHYMESHFNSPGITNEELAKASGISVVYFRKLFSEKYGIPPMRYVRQKRIEKAQALLKSGYSSITEIAFSVGFSSVYHFSKAFKIATGITPTEYLRHCYAEDMKAAAESPPESLV